MYSHTVFKRDARYGSPRFFYDSDHCPLKPKKQKTQIVILNELFEGRMGEGSFLRAPLAGAAFDKMYIGNHVFINSNLLAMARGGITIEDDVQIAANVQLLSNNHDPYDRQVLLCKPIVIKEGAWIGAGASIMAGVTIGEYAIVGAASVVTHDVGDYEVVVGSPARVIKTLDSERFE